MRRDSFKVLVGSHNYNLNHRDSDHDYKVFFYPSFDDLYLGEKYSKAKTGESEDVEYHDIRKLPDMLWKSNVNFIEALFSQEVNEYDNLYNYLYSRREEIARMNLPYLYDACIGMYHKKLKEYQRDKEKDKTKANKHIMSAYRILDFLHRYCSTGFSDFQKAIKYQDSDIARHYLLNIRNGKESGIEESLKEKYESITQLKDIYKEKELNTEVKDWLYNVTKEVVKDWIYYELK